MADKLGVEPAAVKAVVDVESGGQALLPQGTKSPKGTDLSGRPVLRFEPRVYWARRDQKLVADSQLYLERMTLFKSTEHFQRSDWTDYFPKGTWKSWDLHDFIVEFEGPDKAAECSSWGAFQIMGFNHLAAGYPTPSAFAEAQWEEGNQLDSFASFIKADPQLLASLWNKDWKAFARRYNGPGYKANQYDTKIASAYKRHAARKDK
jgi:hypothetical protein